VWDQWNSDSERKEFIQNAVCELRIVSENDLVLNVTSRSAHYRQLVIESENHVLTIQPDGGIAHGWKFDKDPNIYDDGDYLHVDSRDDIKIINTTGVDGIQYIIELE
jgi:hypothetical protein